MRRVSGRAELGRARRARHRLYPARPQAAAADRLRALDLRRREGRVHGAWPRRDRRRAFRMRCASAYITAQRLRRRNQRMFGFKKIAHARGRARRCPAAPARSATANEHFVNHHALKGPYPAGHARRRCSGSAASGAPRSKFWELGDGIYVTAVGYAGGLTPNPTYEEVCSGRTGHNEVVLVVYRPEEDLLRDSCSRPSGKATTRPRACARATTSARNIAPASIPSRRRRSRPREASKKMYEAELKKKGFGADHHRNRRRAGVLFRRGLSPAISRQESARLLRARRHRRELPDRHRRRAAH